MKQILYILGLWIIILNSGLAQIKIEGQLNYGLLTNEKAHGYEIQIKVSKKIKNHHWGISFQNYLSENEGIFINNNKYKYFHDYTGKALEYANAGFPYTGLKVLKTKADKFTMSGINVFRQFKINPQRKNQFNINFGLGIYLVNIIHVDYVIFPDEFYSYELGKYVGLEFDLPIFRFQKYLDPGLDLSINFYRAIKARYGISLNTGLKWLPISENLILNIGMGIYFKNK